MGLLFQRQRQQFYKIHLLMVWQFLIVIHFVVCAVSLTTHHDTCVPVKSLSSEPSLAKLQSATTEHTMHLESCEKRQSSSSSSSSFPSSRRHFFRQVMTATSAVATTATFSIQQPQSAARAAGVFTYIPRPRQAYMPYEDFKKLLESDELQQVEFGIDGRSLVCLDTLGQIHYLKDMPDDPPLLKELYQRGVTVTLQEMKYEKKMNAVSWFRDLVGAADDLTDEEMYKYRGYKTYRQNIPERSYVPANLITGYDLSRNMRR